MSLPTFARNAIADYKSTAAIAPSSRQLASAMVKPLRGRQSRVVVEFGPGTGVITRELLKVLPDDCVLLAFEISPRFVEYLRRTVCDERLHVVQASAETASAELSRRGIHRVDAAISSLGISMMDMVHVESIFHALLPRLGRDGIFVQFQYVHRTRVAAGRVKYFNLETFLERYFKSVRSDCVWLNLPPAHVITCRGAKTGDQPSAV